ncbi:hypothetical protein D3C80_1966720 [compost metagenome]
MAKPEYHQHHAPLGRAYTAQKAERALVQQPGERQQQEDIDRNKDDEHPVPLDIDPVELQRNRQVSPQEQPAVGLARADHGEIFFKREEAQHHQ